MHEAAEDLDFESAARYRNRLEAVEAIRGRQKVVSARPLEIDVVGFFREETVAGVHLFVVREGRVLYGNEFVLDKGLDVPTAELVDGFLLRYYADGAAGPARDRAAGAARGRDTVEEWLTSLRPDRAARCSSPSRSAPRRHDLLTLAEDNARHTLMRFKVRTRYDEERLNSALLQLESALALPAPPLRIECYDISTLHGTQSVGSMVVFTNGRPDPKSYRRFRVRLDIGRGQRRRDDGRGAAASVRARAPGGRPVRQAPRPGDRRRRQAAARGRAGGAGRARPGRHPRRGARQARGGAVRRAGPTSRWCCRRARPRSTWSSACATRRTASPSRTTANCAARP